MWEYKEFRIHLNEDSLNMLGNDDWELITCNVSDSQWRNAYYFYLFKRLKK